MRTTLVTLFSLLTVSLGIWAFRSLPESPKAAQDPGLQAILHEFGAGYAEHSQRVGLRFQDNLPQADRSVAEYEADRAFFQAIDGKLARLDRSELSAPDRLEYGIVAFACALQQERIALSLQYLAEGATESPTGLDALPEGEAWYRYLIKAWTSTRLSPEEVQTLGYRRADFYYQKIHALGFTPDLPVSPTDSTRWFTDEQAAIESAYAATHRATLQRLAIFPAFETLPDLDFAPVASPMMGQVPGYYSSNTLYYNTFNTRYDLRQVDWLYIHEAVPGHHFQVQYEAEVAVPEYRDNMAWGGFREGWAAYVEEKEIGEALGLYQTPEALASMYQWNLIRSVRLVLDVGLNTGQMSDTEALEIWAQYLPNMEATGQREIDRMRRWPAQVLTYMVGSEAILKVREAEKERLGEAFSLSQFHTQMLSQRSIPVVCLPLLFPERS